VQMAWANNLRESGGLLLQGVFDLIVGSGMAIWHLILPRCVIWRWRVTENHGGYFAPELDSIFSAIFSSIS